MLSTAVVWVCLARSPPPQPTPVQQPVPTPDPGERLGQPVRELWRQLVKLEARIEQMMRHLEVENRLSNQIVKQSEAVLAAKSPETKREARAKLLALIDEYQAVRSKHRAEPDPLP